MPVAFLIFAIAVIYLGTGMAFVVASIGDDETINPIASIFAILFWPAYLLAAVGLWLFRSRKAGRASPVNGGSTSRGGQHEIS